MTINVFSGKYGALNFTERIPGTIAGLIIPGAKFKLAATPGNTAFFLFQELGEGEMKVRFYHCSSREKDSLLLLAEPATLLRIALSHTHTFYLPQLGRQRFIERNFNFLHIPHFFAEFAIEQGDNYAFADIILPDKYLQRYADKFPLLHLFLKSVSRHIPAKLCQCNQAASMEMMRWMDGCCEGDAGAIQQLVQAGLSAAQKKPSAGTLRIKPQEIEKIYQVADMLKHTNKSLSLQEISERFDISIYKLNKGFRQIYGHSVLHHRQEEKMRLALRLIYDKRYSVKQVASILDYWPQNFIRAFKHRFGYTPGRNAEGSLPRLPMQTWIN